MTLFGSLTDPDGEGVIADHEQPAGDARFPADRG